MRTEQYQAYWRQPVPCGDEDLVSGEIFTCHDVADLYELQSFLRRKAGEGLEPILYSLEAPGQLSEKPVDIDQIISEQEYDMDSGQRRYWSMRNAGVW